MKLPRDLSGREVAKRLGRHYGYRVTRTRGSHMTVTLLVGSSGARHMRFFMNSVAPAKPFDCVREVREIHIRRNWQSKITSRPVARQKIVRPDISFNI